jgi:hypothetical protein
LQVRQSDNKKSILAEARIDVINFSCLRNCDVMRHKPLLAELGVERDFYSASAPERSTYSSG